MGRRRTKDTVKIEKIRYFYQKSESDTVADFYERYLKDPSRKMQIDGMVFYRIIMLDRLIRQDK